MEEFRGLVLYDIQLDGNLNGVYTNNHPALSGRILTETASARFNGQAYNGTDGRFTYDSIYIDVDNSSVNCELIFTVRNRIIEAVWRSQDEGQIIFRGEGFQMNNGQIAISYWSIRQ